MSISLAMRKTSSSARSAPSKLMPVQPGTWIRASLPVYGGYPPYTGKEARIQVPGWTGISFDGADLADEDVFRMAKLIDMPNLERLSLRNNPRLTEACRPFVAELAARCPKLRAERVRWPEQLSSGGVVGER